MSNSNENLPDPPNIAQLLNELFVIHRHASGREF